MPVYVNGYSDFLIEAAAGLLENASPEARIIAEARRKVLKSIKFKSFEAFMSPSSVTEKLHFYIAEYSDNNRRNAGGGLEEEGEDIEVLEWPSLKPLMR